MPENRCRCCPECDSTDYQYRATMTPDWRCMDCKHEFDDPAWKHSKQSYGNTSPHSMVADKADPEEWP